MKPSMPPRSNAVRERVPVLEPPLPVVRRRVIRGRYDNRSGDAVGGIEREP